MQVVIEFSRVSQPKSLVGCGPGRRSLVGRKATEIFKEREISKSF
jgi:hypothetical protein